MRFFAIFCTDWGIDKWPRIGGLTFGNTRPLAKLWPFDGLGPSACRGDEPRESPPARVHAVRMLMNEEGGRPGVGRGGSLGWARRATSAVLLVVRLWSYAQLHSRDSSAGLALANVLQSLQEYDKTVVTLTSIFGL